MLHVNKYFINLIKRQEEAKVKGKTSKMLEVVLEEKRREIIKEWINSGRIKE